MDIECMLQSAEKLMGQAPRGSPSFYYRRRYVDILREFRRNPCSTQELKGRMGEFIETCAKKRKRGDWEKGPQKKKVKKELHSKKCFVLERSVKTPKIKSILERMEPATNQILENLKGDGIKIKVVLLMVREDEFKNEMSSYTTDELDDWISEFGYYLKYKRTENVIRYGMHYNERAEEAVVCAFMIIAECKTFDGKKYLEINYIQYIDQFSRNWGVQTIIDRMILYVVANYNELSVTCFPLPDWEEFFRSWGFSPMGEEDRREHALYKIFGQPRLGDIGLNFYHLPVGEVCDGKLATMKRDCTKMFKYDKIHPYLWKLFSLGSGVNLEKDWQELVVYLRPFSGDDIDIPESVIREIAALYMYAFGHTWLPPGNLDGIKEDDIVIALYVKPKNMIDMEHLKEWEEEKEENEEHKASVRNALQIINDDVRTIAGTIWMRKVGGEFIYVDILAADKDIKQFGLGKIGASLVHVARRTLNKRSDSVRTTILFSLFTALSFYKTFEISVIQRDGSAKEIKKKLMEKLKNRSAVNYVWNHWVTDEKEKPLPLCIFEKYEGDTDETQLLEQCIELWENIIASGETRPPLGGIFA